MNGRHPETVVAVVVSLQDDRRRKQRERRDRTKRDKRDPIILLEYKRRGFFLLVKSRRFLHLPHTLIHWLKKTNRCCCSQETDQYSSGLILM
jgi:hypothetical protein